MSNIENSENKDKKNLTFKQEGEVSGGNMEPIFKPKFPLMKYGCPFPKLPPHPRPQPHSDPTNPVKPTISEEEKTKSGENIFEPKPDGDQQH